MNPSVSSQSFTSAVYENTSASVEDKNARSDSQKRDQITDSKTQNYSTVDSLSRQYHIFAQRLLLTANTSKQSKDISNVEPRAIELIQAYKELKSNLTHMESVVRGNEDEMKEIKFASEAVGSVGLKRKRTL